MPGPAGPIAFVVLLDTGHRIDLDEDAEQGTLENAVNDAAETGGTVRFGGVTIAAERIVALWPRDLPGVEVIDP